MEAQFIQVMTAVDDEEAAGEVARALVSQRLAACVQIVGPIASTYWWQGEVERSTEWLCLAKTRSDLYPAVESAILAVHPYEVPEIQAVPVLAGSLDYLEWITEVVRRP